jgi:hypothetical protein
MRRKHDEEQYRYFNFSFFAKTTNSLDRSLARSQHYTDKSNPEPMRDISVELELETRAVQQKPPKNQHRQKLPKTQEI